MLNRRFLSLLLLCLLALSGCSRQPVPVPMAQNTGNRAQPAIIDELPSGGYPVQLGGVTLCPPLSMNDLQKLGFTTASMAKQTLSPGEFSDELTFTGNGVSFIGLIYNHQDSVMPVDQCPLVFLTADQFTANEGVTNGSTQAEALAVYGDADDEITDEATRWLLYDEWLYNGLSFEIDIKTQRVKSVSSFCIPSGTLEAAK